MKKKPTRIVDLDEVLVEISECTSNFFYVRFIKRTNGEIRNMECRRGVKKNLKGGTTYDAAEKNLIRVYSTADDGYRSIAIEGIISATVSGTRYIVKGMEEFAGVPILEESCQS